MASKLIINTELDNKILESQIQQLEKELDTLQDKASLSNATKTGYENQLETIKSKMKETGTRADELKLKLEALKNAQTPEEKFSGLKNPEIAELEEQISRADAKMEELVMSYDRVNSNLVKAEKEQDGFNQKIDQANAKLDQLNFKKTQAEIRGVNSGIDTVGKRITGTISSIGRWALALIGIHGIMGTISSAMSIIQQYDTQLAANINYLKYSLAMAIKPLIEWIINGIYTILKLVNQLVGLLFGINLFKGADKFASKMKSAAGSSKKIKDNLQSAGFDEMNILNDNKSGGGGAGGGTPNMNLNDMGEVPEWMKWIVENKDILIGALLGIAAAILAIKLGLSLITGLGIGVMVMGIVMFIQDLIKYLNDPTWANFGDLLKDFGVIIIGLGIIMGSWQIIVLGVLTAIVGYVMENWDTIKGVLIKVGGWIYDNVLVPVGNVIKKVLDVILTMIVVAFATIGTVVLSIVNVVEGVLTTIWGIIKSIVNAIVTIIKTAISSIKTVVVGIVTIIKQLINGDIKGAFNTLKSMLKTLAGNIWTIMKTPINLIIDAINSLIEGINKIKIETPDWTPGIGKKTLGFNINKIPRLATGAIVNLPGKGVPIGIAGESGQEGVIPLTDPTAMEMLGEAIGRYITMNLVNNVNLNGRQIAREVKKINSQNAFMLNG